MDTIKKVLARGRYSAVGSNAKKALFLQQVERGKGREFLNDASLKFLHANNTSQFTGHCGRVICSDEYIRHIQKRIFRRQSKWSSDWYIYESDIVRNDATGNILFGYLGKVFGYTDDFLVFGAGAYQLATNPLHSSSGELYFDDPYDTQMIQKGIAYYKKTH